VLSAAAVVLTWLRRNDCQQAVLFLTGVMVVHVPSAYSAAAQQGKSCGEGQQQAPFPVPCSGEHGVGCETTGPTMPSVSLSRFIPVNRVGV